VKPSERLKEIEDNINTNYVHHESMSWLIARVKRLTEACEKYEKTFVTLEAQINLRPEMFKVWKDQMNFLLGDARKALEEE